MGLNFWSDGNMGLCMLEGPAQRGTVVTNKLYMLQKGWAMSDFKAATNVLSWIGL